ncbi:HNH homing endonuclease [Acinetobacter phage Phab24]|nr:HNH homing endonuclease [Acinetobacter phage Phab24]
MERVFVRPVVGFEKEYVVSNSGDVYSIPRKGTWVLKKLTPQINHNGYKRVTLTKGGKRNYLFIHRIVAITFIDNPLNKSTVNHIDGVKFNNNLLNLEWATQSENTQHAVDNNLIRRAKGEDMSRVLTESDIVEILRLRSKGMTQKEIGVKIGRPTSTIQCILNGRRWSHITGIRFGIDKPL